LNPARSYRIPRLLLGLLLCAAATTLTASTFFKPFTASFSVWRGALPLGKLELNFSLDEGETYSYHAHTRPGFLAGLFSGDEIIEESRGHLGEKRVLPVNYSYHETDNSEDNAEVSFDWPAKKVYTSSGGITWAQDIVAGIQDRLSQQLMLRLELARGEHDLSYRVADGGKLKHYRFQVVGEEQVQTPYGRLHCLKVRRSKEERPPDYTIWFAPQLDYLPVRIERDQGSGRYRMVLEELEGF
jgi:hypothetical protein